MYQLLKPIPHGLKVMLTEIESHIREVGLEAVRTIATDKVSYTCHTVHVPVCLFILCFSVCLFGCYHLSVYCVCCLYV